MKSPRRLLLFLPLLLGVPAILWYGVLTTPASRELGRELVRLSDRLHGSADSPGETFATTLRVVSVEGLPKELADRTLALAMRFPDRLLLTAAVDGNDYTIARAGEEVIVSVPHQKLHLVGRNDVPRFSGDPTSLATIALPDFGFPVPRWQLALVPALVKSSVDAGEEITGQSFRLRPLFASLADLPGDLHLALDRDASNQLVGVSAGTGGKSIVLAIESFDWPETDPDWTPEAAPDVEIETVPLAHLDRFARVGLGNLGKTIPPLPPSDGSRELVASHGKGRLERVDGTSVLFLEGTPEEMGEQHGILMRDAIHNLVDRIVYGVGVGSSFGKGRWFFGEIEEAQSRLEPFADPRHLREMDALATAAGLHPQEVRLANFFPELFHCSGFALHGSATVDGELYHGRILDYLRGLGLEENAVVIVVKPDEGNAWVNLGYAGFTGTVTAMNERQVAIGEMGGRGEGDWDGKPMAQLMREVMERADTIDEAVEIMRKGPRTCEYYYVISDGKTNRAVGIKATPEIFETVWSGESHPQLARPVEDTVLMSAGDRYEALVDLVEEDFGKFDAKSARALMDPPVCMNSNIQSVLFAPGSLDFWVANADSENVASLTRYTRYNLRELLEGEPSNPGENLTKR